ncbi:sensor histidine kinase [Kineococcus rubinsiae]|uniref:sensor histidine kinase n=1 Tax=Kineococcus rubinsiae TaxID=2609562 RepID=UPI0014306431|nr:HAMP domain-containing sensor histidine kinase [Kineococcus rubinsiae]NIZ91145.1 HAMP domain-containing histidine kinase [Kineococcus rubinsiae]
MSVPAQRLRGWRERAVATESRIPLRVRLLVIVVLLLVAAMTVTGLVSLHLLRTNLQAQVDDELQSKGQTAVVASLPQLSQSSAQNPLLTNYYLRFTDTAGGGYREVCTKDAGGACEAAPDLPAMTTAEVASHRNRPFTVPDAGGGDPWRVILFSATDSRLNVAVALPLSGANRTVEDYQTVAIVVGGAVLVVGTFLAALAIRRSFRPLVDIERTASAIASGDLSRRVTGGSPGTEIGRLSNALNAMLTQIEQAFRAQQHSEEQMRRFVADASHELRTPLAAIRGFAELHRQGAVREPADVAHVMGRIEGESTRLGRLVEDLLALARLDEAQRKRADAPELVDLAVIASDAVHDARGLAGDRAVRLTGLDPASGPRSALVLADDAGMRQVLTNLLANAVHHTPAGTPVEVAVGRLLGPSGPESLVEVRDHGPGLAPAEAEKVFERFYRVDASRQRGTGGGSGLGLAIVATIVARHGGTVAVTATPGGGATFRVRFRAVDAPAELDDDEPADDGPAALADGVPPRS